MLRQIERYCRRRGIAETTFGRLALNDGKLVANLRAGRDIRLTTLNRLRRFLARETGEEARL